MNDPYETHGRQPNDPEPPALETVDSSQHIGRYRVEKVLGKGGFGLVYLAHDEQLHRSVAIKVPRSNLVASRQDAEEYLAEARTVAGLDHPNIVSVYDIGSSAEHPYFIVSKYIKGHALAQRIHDDRPSLIEIVELTATIAEALHYAHGKGVVHRDIKPGNILVDAAGKPFVADFGLALKDEQVGHGAGYVGTPAYMSPEQARGEGHRVDGRSDIFSLGIVLYELLAGRHPFQSESLTDLREQIMSVEPRPLRQWDAGIPKELERICHKALAKRTSERYTTAKDLADDLRYFLTENPKDKETGRQGVKDTQTNSPKPDRPSSVSVPPSLPVSLSAPLKIVPQGLRSFGAHDADFFLELLPGPRDREGLPDSLRFWKTRIEETDADSTFSVALLYGPSGCGKSSMMKAGLLPRLSENVIRVYLEATADETETRLLAGLRKRCPTLPVNLGLKDTLAALRRGQGLPTGKKALIVLDQFEQWLHAKKELPDAPLVQALRQCDGGHVQCIVMVRDDFWMAATRFMRDLEIRLLEGQNSAAVDLFDLEHAKKVLTAFGRAFGKLPEPPAEISKEQKDFLKQAIDGLAQEGKVICVRLALFAEMMKGKPWTPATLAEVGGAAGIGVTFLEETFSAATAPPEHRYHQKAIRSVLQALLPDAGADIKGHMRQHAELLQASGYAGRPNDFDDLTRILDSELRLITPTDPDGKQSVDDSMSQVSPGQKYYQLTHDYLVHSLRDWLTHKQKETRRGRAELLLADCAADWNIRPEARRLPSLWQWAGIWILTKRTNWTPSQRKMMGSANRFHLARIVTATVLLALVFWGGYETYGRLNAHGLRDRLLNANIADVPAVTRDMAPYRRWTAPLLRDALKDAEAKGDPRGQLHASLALLPTDPDQLEYLFGRLLDATPQEMPVLRDALEPHKDALQEKLWSIALQPGKGRESQRLRAASAMALYDPLGSRWTKIGNAVANDLVNVPTVYLAIWLDALRNVNGVLLRPLSAIYRDAQRRETERSLATDILSDYAGTDPPVLADLLLDANELQFVKLFVKLKPYQDRVEPALRKTAATTLASKTTDTDKEYLANRQANAAVVLAKMGHADAVWPLLKHSSDPRTRSLLIHRLAALDIDPHLLLQRLDAEPDVSIQHALLLALSAYDANQLSAARRSQTAPKLAAIYRDHPDAGLHAAAAWLLREWKQADQIKPIDDAWKNDGPKRLERNAQIRRELASGKGKTFWYINGQEQTMVVMPGPVDVWIGSPATEAGREEGNMELRHQKRINRSFALAAKEVTVEQFRRFRKEHKHNPQYAPTLDSPVNKVTWYDAAAYCNWLSEQEGIPKKEWCYLPNAAGQFADGMKLADNYLSLEGYRLPSEAEWEYACRAGAVTARYYGETGDLLEKYSWHTKNTEDRAMKPVGMLKPNDFGLFDMFGNALEWCQDPSNEYPSATQSLEDKEHDLTVVNQQYRALRSGAFYYALVANRAANRSRNVPTVQTNYIGFRPARSIHPN